MFLPKALSFPVAFSPAYFCKWFISVETQEGMYIQALPIVPIFSRKSMEDTKSASQSPSRCWDSPLKGGEGYPGSRFRRSQLMVRRKDLGERSGWRPGGQEAEEKGRAGGRE